MLAMLACGGEGKRGLREVGVVEHAADEGYY